MNETNYQAGWASVEFTPEPGLRLLGQMHQRIATHARDPLSVNALALRCGEMTVVLVACDVCILDNTFVAKAQSSFSKATGLVGSTLLIHATHTHVAPISTGELMEQPVPEFEELLQGKVLEAAQTALKGMEPVDIFATTGQLENLGWNRRAMYEDGTSRMYGNSTNDGFVGLEGPRDPSLPVLWTKNADGEITGVLTGFATHPNCMEGESFYSADLPGAARKYIRKMLGEKIGVLYLTGAAGNTAPSILDPFDADQPWRGDAGVERSGLYLAGEVAKLVAQTLKPMESEVLSLHGTQLSIPLRQWPQKNDPAFAGFGREYYDHAAKLWPQRLKERSPFPVRVNVVRIGDVAICTNPAEYFVEFGLQIKSNSPAKVSFICELTDGYCGYVPTEKAFARGGYETWCAPSSQLEPRAGARIALDTQKLLHTAWKKK